MTHTSRLSGVGQLIDALGLPEEPMGIFYSGRAPAAGVAPRAQVPLSRRNETSGDGINWTACVLGKVRRARREKKAAYFDESRYGCPGGAFFMGFKPGYEPFEPSLISTGIQDKFEGERYVDSPETGKVFYDGFEPPGAAGPVLVIQPLSLFKEGEQPELVAMFPDRNALVGLTALTTFVTGDPEAVRAPFGVGCCSLISWPRKYLLQGKHQAVMGCFDINCIKYLNREELIYVVSFGLFEKMLAQWPESLLGTRAWQRLNRGSQDQRMK